MIDDRVDRLDKTKRVEHFRISMIGKCSSLPSLAAVQLPAAASLALPPYAGHIGMISKAAREAGHELIIGLPMKPDARATGSALGVIDQAAPRTIALLAPWVRHLGKTGITVVPVRDRAANR